MITTTSPIEHPQLQGVKVFSLEACPVKNKPQQVLVACEPHAQIPLHHHRHDATMFVVSGNALILASNPELNGKRVQTGDRVFFRKEHGHGFQAGSEGMSFLSTNGGIADSNPANWDMQFA
jgi:quercetin dioxygenase-like cupin family protein